MSSGWLAGQSGWFASDTTVLFVLVSDSGKWTLANKQRKDQKRDTDKDVAHFLLDREVLLKFIMPNVKSTLSKLWTLFWGNVTLD